MTARDGALRRPAPPSPSGRKIHTVPGLDTTNEPLIEFWKNDGEPPRPRESDTVMATVRRPAAPAYSVTIEPGRVMIEHNRRGTVLDYRVDYSMVVMGPRYGLFLDAERTVWDRLPDYVKADAHDATGRAYVAMQAI